MAKTMKKAVAYLRTSSATNVGQDKDSDKRQLAAIHAFAKANGYEVTKVFYDAAVSGADPVHERAGFAAMLAHLAQTPSGGATTGAPAHGDGQAPATPPTPTVLIPAAPPEKKYILVESPDRFARDLAVQLAGHDMLRAQGIDLIPASAPDFFLEDTPTAVLVRQVLGAIAQFEKASLVAKLAAARARKKAAGGRGDGRKPISETHPQATLLAKQLRRKKPKGGVMSLRDISAELAAQGHLNERGAPFNPRAVMAMINS
jgi:DNA invertase Pin-like site-specific DNA recombinase